MKTDRFSGGISKQFFFYLVSEHPAPCLGLESGRWGVALVSRTPLELTFFSVQVFPPPDVILNSSRVIGACPVTTNCPCCGDELNPRTSTTTIKWLTDGGLQRLNLRKSRCVHRTTKKIYPRLGHTDNFFRSLISATCV